MTTSRRSASCAVGLAAAILLSGCVAAPETGEPALQPMWTAEVSLLSAPRVAGEVVLAYVVSDELQAEMVAWDLATGEERWREAAVPGNTAPGVEHVVAVTQIAGAWTVGFMRDRGDGEMTVAIRDAATGESITPALDESFVNGSRPFPCGNSYCLTARTPYLDREFLRVDTETEWLEFTSQGGYFAQRDKTPFLTGGRLIGEFVSNTVDDRGVETLRYGRGGTMLWSRDYEEVFGEGAGTSGGWHWSDGAIDRPLLGVGYLEWAGPYEEGEQVSQDLTATRLVALDPDSGDELWRIDGARSCAPSGSRLRSDDLVVVCQYRAGTSNWIAGGDDPADWSDVEVDLVAYEEGTGRERWRQPIEGVAANLRTDSRTVAVGEQPVLFVDGRAALIDAQTGAIESLGGSDALVCESTADRHTELEEPWWDEGSEFSMTAIMMPCSADHDADDPIGFTDSALTLAGYDARYPAALAVDGGLEVFAPRS